MIFLWPRFEIGARSTLFARMGPARRRFIISAAIAVSFAMVRCASAVLNPQVTLAWDPPVQYETLGYKVYYGYASRAYVKSIDAGTATICTVTGLDTTSTYHFAVTSYDPANAEGDYSSELVWSVNDPDNDGMADLWEILHFGGTQTTSGLATVDCDRDGLRNVDEYVVGSNPTNPETFKNVDVDVSGGQCEASFAAMAAAGLGYSGKTRYYTLEACTDLVAGSWSSVPGYGAIVASNQTVLRVSAATGVISYRTRIWLN